MTRLNFPPLTRGLHQEAGKDYIFDILRKKKVRATPEEWVRQHLIHFLIHHRGYPKGLMKVERSLSYGKLIQRADLVIYDRSAAPLVVAECKAAHKVLDESTLAQIARYNYVMAAPFLLATNGLVHYFFALDRAEQCYHPQHEIPTYRELCPLGGVSA
jgi:hypothetical protein